MITISKFDINIIFDFEFYCKLLNINFHLQKGNMKNFYSQISDESKFQNFIQYFKLKKLDDVIYLLSFFVFQKNFFIHERLKK